MIPNAPEHVIERQEQHAQVTELEVIAFLKARAESLLAKTGKPSAGISLCVCVGGPGAHVAAYANSEAACTQVISSDWTGCIDTAVDGLVSQISSTREALPVVDPVSPAAEVRAA